MEPLLDNLSTIIGRRTLLVEPIEIHWNILVHNVGSGLFDPQIGQIVTQLLIGVNITGMNVL
jgi:hypothetical protein